MKKVLRYVLIILLFGLVFLSLNQKTVNANEVIEIVIENININTMEELKTAFGGKATIDGNTIKLTENIVLTDNPLDIEIPEIVIDFNGKTIECKKYARISLYNKATFKDSSTTDRSKWGGIILNNESTDSIFVMDNAELVINSGRFIDGGTKTYSKLSINGKITINDATFSTTRTESVYNYNTMISLSASAECIINGGEFYNTDSIIETGGSKYACGSKLTINGGSFKCLNSDAIRIYSFYPYVDGNNKKQLITPKIVLNNCKIEAKSTAIGFWGGCTDEEFKNADTKILTVNGGIYTGLETSQGSPLEIRTYADPKTYFNPKDFILKGGTFESLKDSVGAIKLYGPSKRRI